MVPGGTKGKVPEHRNGFENNQSTGIEPAGGTCTGSGLSVEFNLLSRALQRRPRRLKNCMVVLEKLEGKQTHGQDKLILRHVTELNTDEKILSLNPLSFSRQKFSSFKPHS